MRWARLCICGASWRFESGLISRVLAPRELVLFLSSLWKLCGEKTRFACGSTVVGCRLFSLALDLRLSVGRAFLIRAPVWGVTLGALDAWFCALAASRGRRA